MQIAIIGAGRVGRALGAGWAAAGHVVAHGVRDPGDARHGELDTGSIDDVVARSDVVVLAIPWPATEELARTLAVGDRVVVDATNPIAASPPAGAISGAERLAGWTGSTRVVKAFNTTGAANLARPAYPSGVPCMPLAGDDDDAVEVVAGLAADLGFEPLRCGGLTHAIDLEHLARLWIQLAHRAGSGPDIAFALLRR